MPIFDITGDDVAFLDDEKLRELVARLCEAELRQRGLSPVHVTWGGNQNSVDGGIDVRVALPQTPVSGFIPRAATGFQVKQEDTPPSKIAEEMRPKGVLRPSIQALADGCGAYIMVSSQGSTADTPLANRRQAMSAAVKGELNGDNLFLDFYDRTRIATWVRMHEGIIPWVRELVGRRIPGWHSYGAWANPSEPLSAKYLVDDKIRINSNTRHKYMSVSALEGIHQLRQQLQEPRSIVRLVGLSGVGKTRLVQALFDERIGEQSLNSAISIYTNVADSPDPQPVALASDLVARQTRAILVIDNCTPELHHRLSEVCRQPESQVSVITVEYDIHDDEPEGTEVFRLEASSPELIEKLVRLQFPELSQVDAHTIAEFSGGNARIAIALSARIEHNETLAGLNDEQLFQRLFVQRQTPDQSLYLAAQVCSLVYSFQGEDLSDGEDSEMIRLGALIDTTPLKLYRHVAALHQRELVQQRGVWRAVLPHAVANRLATVALKIIPYNAIDEHLLKTPSGRLKKSFARRLGYLHTSKEAVKIVTQWLSSGGLLHDLTNFNDLERAMFRSIAPVAPEAVLVALERTCAENPSACQQYVDLLRLVAYEATYFERCVELLVLILAAGQEEERSKGREVFASLFHLHLSGTHAQIGKRLTVLRALLDSDDAKRRDLGVLGIRAALEALHFTPVGQFDFGARPRDYGYWPGTVDEVRNWFNTVFKSIEHLACENTAAAVQIRAAVAEKFRGIWLRSTVNAELIGLCRRLNDTRFWPEVWLAIRNTLDLDGKNMREDDLQHLVALERVLRPTDLVQKVRSIVLSSRHCGVHLDDFEDHTTDDINTRIARTEAIARDLGIAVANDETALGELLPDVVSSVGRLWSFGEGLYAGATDPIQLWDRLVAAFSNTEESLRKPEVLRGFLHATHQKAPALTDVLLDQSLEHDTLATYYPFLQTAVPLGEIAVQRLNRSLGNGKTPVLMYSYLQFGRATDPIPPADLRDLVLRIAAIPTGNDVALKLLYMRILSDGDKKEGILPEIVDAGCELLRRLDFTKNKGDDYHIGQIAKFCLIGKEGADLAGDVCGRLKAAVEKYETRIILHDDLLQGLFLAQPIASLEALCGGDEQDLDRGVEMLSIVESHKCPLNVISDYDLIRWCDEQPATRYVAMAGVITSFKSENDSAPRWTGLGLQFLERAPDPAAVLSRFTARFQPSGVWPGSPSPASTMETNATLLDQLDSFPALQAAIENEKTSVQQRITRERIRETRLDREWNERFE